MEEYALFNWLAQPVDSTRPHEVGTFVSWHGRMMTLAWGVIVPAAVLVTRFFKILPCQDWPEKLDNPAWWHIHWKGQSAAFILTIAGAVVILLAEREQTTTLHRGIGYGIIALAALQLLSGVFRGTKGGPTAPAPDGSWRGDHFDMSPRRVRFERLHKGLGYFLVLGGVTTTLNGLWAANGPLWMWLAMLLWWLGLALVAVFLELRFGSYDTYQAIWGPDPQLPGNRLTYRSFGAIRPGDQPMVWLKKAPTGGWTSGRRGD